MIFIYNLIKEIIKWLKTKKITEKIKKNKTNILFTIIIVITIYLKLKTTWCQPNNFKTPYFIENKIGEFSYFYQNSINLNCSKLAFEEYVYYLKNHELNLNIAKYYDINGKFNLNSNFSHPNIFVGSFNNFYANLPMSHSKYKDYYQNFGKPDLLGLKRNQYVSNKIFLYDFNENMQFILNKKIDYSNLKRIGNNNVIKDIINQQKYIANYKNYLEIKKEDYLNFINKSYNK